MKTLVWILVFVFWLNLGLCQNNRQIDSLRYLLLSTDSRSYKEVSDITSQLAWELCRISQYDSGLSYYRKALANPYQDPNPSWRASIHFGIGACHTALGRLDSSIFYYQKALEEFKVADDRANIALTCTNLSIVFKNQGLYEEALGSAITAAAIFEEEKNNRSLAACYNTIGLILSKIKNYDDALKYHHDAVRLISGLDESSFLAKFYNNLGELFILTHQYDSARSNLLHAAGLKRQLNDTKGLARTINNLGKISMLTGNLPNAQTEFNQSLDIQRQIDDPTGMIEVLNNLGELHLLNRDHKQAASYLQESEKIIRRAGTPEYLRQNLELQVKLARQTNDFAQGMNKLEELLLIRDSLLNEEKSKSLLAMQIRYETDKKEQQIALLEQSAEISRTKIKNSRILIGSLVVGLVLVGAIGVLVYINLKNARAAKQRIELLLAETRHRIKNNLQTLASIFHLQTRHYTDHEMALEARSSESRVHTMSMLHEKFYSADADHIITTRAYITDLIHKLVDVYGANTKGLRLHLRVDDIELDIDKALALSLIIQELVCNAFKYAFDHKSDPELTVSIRLIGNDVVTTVKDNGIGISEHSIGTSQGFSLVDALVAQLDGKLKFENSDGTLFIIRFPTTQWKKRLFS